MPSGVCWNYGKLLKQPYLGWIPNKIIYTRSYVDTNLWILLITMKKLQYHWLKLAYTVQKFYPEQ